MELLERQGPLEHLSAALAAARDGTSRVVIVRGEAGIGKTSFVRTFIESEGVAAVIGRCDDASVPTPLGPFRDIFRAAGLEVGMDADEVRSSVSTVLDQYRMVLIEDIHWADQATLDVVAHMCRRASDHETLIALTQRPLDHPYLLRCLAQIPSDVSSTVDLQPLSRSAVLDLSERRGRDGEAIFDKTGGNPFLVGELLDAPDGEIPSRVATATLARLTLLSPPARRLADLITLFPRGTTWHTVERLRPESEEALDELELGRWLDADVDDIRFRHELIRETIVEAMPSARARRLHQEIVEVLIEQEDDPAPIAHHAAHARDEARSIDYAVLAARALSRTGAHRDALVHLERVAHLADRLSDDERAQFTESVGMERRANEQSAESVEPLMDASRQWLDLGDVDSAARTLAVASSSLWRTGRLDESLAVLDEALAHLEGTEHHERRFRTQVIRAQSIGLVSRWPEAVAALDDALAHSPEAGPEPRALALAVRADGRRILGLEKEGLADYDASLALVEDTSAHSVRTGALSNRVATSLAVLHLDAAAMHLDEARAAAKDLQSERVDSILGDFQCGLDFHRGEWDAALSIAGKFAKDPTPVRVRPLYIDYLIRMRRSEQPSIELLHESYERAAQLEDIQRLGSVAAAYAELIWMGILDDPTRLLETAKLAVRAGHARYIAELALWCRRLGLGEPNTHSTLGPPAYLLELAGDPLAAAEEWGRRGVPFERILGLGFSDRPDAIRQAIDEALALSAVATADRLRARLRKLGHSAPRGRGRASLSNPEGLTKRQVDVVRLLHLTNQQVADRLYISSKTVEHHVSAILAALDVSDRREAAAWALDQGLVDRPGGGEPQR